MHPRRLFGEICLELGYADSNDIRQALQQQETLKKAGKPHKMIGLILLERCVLSNEQLIDVLQEMDIRNKLS